MPALLLEGLMISSVSSSEAFSEDEELLFPKELEEESSEYAESFIDELDFEDSPAEA